jgi:hypothetical protein
MPGLHGLRSKGRQTYEAIRCCEVHCDVMRPNGLLCHHLIVLKGDSQNKSKVQNLITTRTPMKTHALSKLHFVTHNGGPGTER